MKSLIYILIFMGLLYGSLLFRLNSFGIRYNNDRKDKNIPLLDTAWSVNKSIFGAQSTYTPIKINGNRYHLRKTVEINYLTGIIQEYDYYIIEDHKISIDAIYNYKVPKHWNIRYFGSNKTVKELSVSNFLDTLKKYKVGN